MILNQTAPRNKIQYITINNIVIKRIGERQSPSFFIDLPSPAQSKSPGLFARPHSPGMSPDEFSASILKALVWVGLVYDDLWCLLNNVRFAQCDQNRQVVSQAIKSILNSIKLALAHKTKSSHTARMSNAKENFYSAGDYTNTVKYCIFRVAIT